MPHVNRSSAILSDNRSRMELISEKKVVAWLENNKSYLLTISGILLFIIVSSIVFVAYQKYWTATALEELRLGVNELQNNNKKEAIEHLQEAENLLGIEKAAGKVAAFYLNEAYNHGKNEIQYKSNNFVTFSASQEHQGYLAQILLMAQGRIAEKKKDFITAQKLYKEASAIDGPFSAEALLRAARTSELANDMSSATAFREKYIATYPNTPFTDVVRRKLGK